MTNHTINSTIFLGFMSDYWYHCYDDFIHVEVDISKNHIFITKHTINSNILLGSMSDCLLISMSWWFFSCLCRHFKKAYFMTNHTIKSNIFLGFMPKLLIDIKVVMIFFNS